MDRVKISGGCVCTLRSIREKTTDDAGLELIDCIKSISISWKGCKELKAEVLEGFESWLIALDPKSYEREYKQRREQEFLVTT